VLGTRIPAPCCAFDLSKEDQQLICFNWKNIRPLWGIDNIIKGSKVCIDEIEKQALNVSVFTAQVKEGELRGRPEIPNTNSSEGQANPLGMVTTLEQTTGKSATKLVS
jgi:hypothetical protein